MFIQYNRDQEGKLHELPAKHVDTGMGFERLCAVIQKKNSNYDTDVFAPVIEAVSKLAKVPYEKEEDMVAMRVIADHIRTLTFAIADGAVPGNEGRGYVLRRILRRAARYGRKLNLKQPFLYKIVNTLVENMGYQFPEIKNNRSNVEKIIKAEEESFNATLDRGIDLFEGIVKTMKEKGITVIPGEDVFKLYDTFGFPVDLTNVMAREAGFSIDEDRFNVLMEEQKARARKSTKDKIAHAHVVVDSFAGFELLSEEPTKFLGYENMTAEGKVVGIKYEGDQTLVVLNQTPFYAESGGQCSDTGTITVGADVLDVVDLTKINGIVVHIVDNPGKIKIEMNSAVSASVDEVRRWDIMRNHSATHFLHAALREVLGNHVQQSGSYVGPDRLRFDFTHFQKVGEEELKRIEAIVNEKIRESLPRHHHKDTPFEEAKKMGALMFFGDKYGDKVNVVQFGNYTLEFCGGTHVENGAQIGMLKILSESSIASGVRRIEAVTGSGVEKFIEHQEARIKAHEERISEISEEKRKLEKELAEIKLKEKLGGIDTVVNSAKVINGINVYMGKVEASNMDELKSMGDELRNKMKTGAGLLISTVEDKVAIVAVVTDDLIKDKKLSAGKIVGEVAKIVGGGGGGRPHLATAGGKDVSKIDEALASFEKMF